MSCFVPTEATTLPPESGGVSIVLVIAIAVVVIIVILAVGEFQCMGGTHTPFNDSNVDSNLLLSFPDTHAHRLHS